MRIRHAAALALCLTLCGGAAWARTLTPDALREAAVLALSRGEAQAALAMAEALLERDGTDAAALALRSRARRDLGHHDGALRDARTAWAAATTRQDRYRAAMLRAQALSSRGNRTRARFWLRRAAEIAPSDAAARQARRDLRFVRARDPLSVRLSFGISPTDNVNAGNSSAEVTYLGDTRRPVGTSRALPGTRVTLGTDLRYRLRQRPNVEDHATASLLHQTYRLNDRARDILETDLVSLGVDPETGEIVRTTPDHGVDGGDFAYSALAFGLERRFTPGPGRGLYDISVEMGRDWYGGAPYSRFFEAGAGTTAALGPRSTVALGLTGRATRRETGGEDGIGRATLDARLDHRLESGARLVLAADLRESRSGAVAFDYREAGLGISYIHGDPVLGAAVTLSAEIAASDFGDWPFALGAPSGDPTRRDLTLGAGIDMVLPALSRWGFAPAIGLTARERRSNVDIVEYEQISIGVSLRSIF